MKNITLLLLTIMAFIFTACEDDMNQISNLKNK